MGAVISECRSDPNDSTVPPPRPDRPEPYLSDLSAPDHRRRRRTPRIAQTSSGAPERAAQLLQAGTGPGAGPEASERRGHAHGLAHVQRRARPRGPARSPPASPAARPGPPAAYRSRGPNGRRPRPSGTGTEAAGRAGDGPRAHFRVRDLLPARGASFRRRPCPAAAGSGSARSRRGGGGRPGLAGAAGGPRAGRRAAEPGPTTMPRRKQSHPQPVKGECAAGPGGDGGGGGRSPAVTRGARCVAAEAEDGPEETAGAALVLPGDLLLGRGLACEKGPPGACRRPARPRRDPRRRPPVGGLHPHPPGEPPPR